MFAFHASTRDPIHGKSLSAIHRPKPTLTPFSKLNEIRCHPTVKILQLMHETRRKSQVNDTDAHIPPEIEPTPRLSVLIPSYNQPILLRACLRSIIPQLRANDEIVVSDDASSADMSEMQTHITDPRVKWYFHSTNVGYGGNLNRAFAAATGDLIMLMGHDDLLLPGAIQQSIRPFTDPNTGVVTRPYYWFFETPNRPNRAVYPLIPGQNRTLTTSSDPNELISMYWSIAQLSGLVFRRSLMQEAFHTEIFTSHVWPFLQVFKASQCVSLGRYTVAVRTESSMTRHSRHVYARSPTQAWIDCFDTTFSCASLASCRNAGLDFLASVGPLGLVQLRTYGGLAYVLKELLVFKRLGWRRLLRPPFIGLTALSILLPGSLLRPLADTIRRHILGPRALRRGGIPDVTSLNMGAS